MVFFSQQVMGNASALMQSEDWAALIADARERNCYLDMDSLPKEFPRDPIPKELLGPRASTYSQGRYVSNARGFRSGGLRHRSYDLHMDSGSGTPSEDEEKSGAPVIPYRNGNYRSFRPALENSLDDFGKLGDKSRDAWQYGIQKKQSFPSALGKRD